MTAAALGTKMERAYEAGELLHALAARYIWWESPDEAMMMPERVIAQVMNIGTYKDTQLLVKSVKTEVLRNVLAHAGVSEISCSRRSWKFIRTIE